MVEADGDAIGEDFGSVRPAPAIKIGRKFELTGLRPHMDVHLVSSLPKDLGQARAVAEGIEVISDARDDAESPAEIGAALGDLADRRFDARHVDVGLQRPASADGPAAGPDEPLDLAEERRVEPFDPAIEHSLVVAEDEIAALAQEFGRDPERGHGLGRALLPAPLPDRVEVGVANQVDGRLLDHGAPPSGPVFRASAANFLK